MLTNSRGTVRQYCSSIAMPRMTSIADTKLHRSILLQNPGTAVALSKPMSPEDMSVNDKLANIFCSTHPQSENAWFWRKVTHYLQSFFV